MRNIPGVGDLCGGDVETENLYPHGRGGRVPNSFASSFSMEPFDTRILTKHDVFISG